MKRILIVNPFGIGDVLFSMFLVEALRAAYPGAFIGFLCNERTQDLVRMNTSIDRTFVFHRDLFRRLWRKHPFLFFRKLKALLGMLKDEAFDTMFDLSLGRQYGFFAFWIGIQRRVGFDFKGRGTFLTHKRRITGYEGRPVVEIQLDLFDLVGVHPALGRIRPPALAVSAEAARAADALLERYGFGKEDRILALAPGGGKSWGADAVYKQWGGERFAEACNALLKTKPCKVLLLGDRRERDLLTRTGGMIQGWKAVVADASLPEVCALLKRASLLLGNDGGLLHVANALGVRTVSIFGPVDEKVYGPYGGLAERRVLTQDVPCRPCYRRFTFPPCPYQRRCLDSLSVGKVAAALEGIF